MNNRRVKACITAAIVGVLYFMPFPSLKADEGQQFGPWSQPVNLGSVVNSTNGDFFPCISKDGLSLYFSSSRPGGYGGWDIYVSRRSTIDDAWGAPENLGPTINTAANEGRPSMSPDGHLMFFASDRPVLDADGNPVNVGNDIYVSRRHDKRDDFGWQTPWNVGGGVNTEYNEASPNIFEDEQTGKMFLYFDSNRPGGPGPLTDDAAHNGNDIYVSELQGEGIFGSAVLVSELSTGYIERQPNIRRDGLELFFTSNRPGSLNGTLDLWVATRASTADPWSGITNLGSLVNAGVNGAFNGNDAGAALAFDGTALYFQSVRPGTLGNYDLYVITRTKQD